MDDARVDELLMVLAADEPALASGELRHRVVLVPTFAPEALLSVRFGAPASLRVAGLGPTPYAAEVVLAEDVAAQLRAELAACVPGLGDHDARVGRDGVTLCFEVEVGGGARRRDFGWSPEPGQLRHRHVAALHAAARASIADLRATRTLAQLHGYLELDGPLRDHWGAPRRIELCGRLGVHERDMLVEFLARVPADAAVLVDMRRCEDVAALLLPVLRRFARRSGSLAWLVTPATRELLHAARVPRRQMFAGLDEALRSLGG